MRERQLEHLKAEAEQRDYAETVRLWEPLAGLADAARLPLADLTAAALRRMSPGQYETFRAQIDRLTMADGRVAVFEFVLRVVLERHLDEAFDRRKTPSRAASGPVTQQVAAAMSLLAWEGHADAAAAEKAFGAGMASYLRGKNTVEMVPRDRCSLAAFEQALNVLSAGTPGAKKRVLMACHACIAADKQVTVREAELFRAIGDVLGCPMPPVPASAA